MTDGGFREMVVEFRIKVSSLIILSIVLSCIRRYKLNPKYIFQ